MKTIAETYQCVAPFEIALLAIEKGFDLPTIHVWCDYDTIHQRSVNKHPIIVRSNSQRDRFIAAPTRELLRKWLREYHNIHIEINLSGDIPYNKFYYYIMKIGQYFTMSTSDDQESFVTYEEALDTSLIKVLKRLIIP